MSNALNTLFSNIAAAIRTKNGSSNTYYPNQMANAILAIPTGGSTINNQDKTVTPTSSQQLVSYDSGYTGLGTVTVYPIPSQYIVPEGTLQVTTNGIKDVTNYASINVNVPIENFNVSSLIVTPSETEQVFDGSASEDQIVNQTMRAGSGNSYTFPTPLTVGATYHMECIAYDDDRQKSYSYNADFVCSTTAETICYYIVINNTSMYGLSMLDRYNVKIYEIAVDGYLPVTVSAISSTYIGSGITQRDSDDLSASGATITAPAGYYAAAASKSVATMTLPTAAASSATSGYTSKATIGRSTSAQYINIPPGYNSAGGYYVISAVANGSASAPSTISGTSATVSTGTNTLTLTKTVSVTPVVSAGYVSSGTATNSSVSLTTSVTTKAAATITPGTSNQTIAAGTYLTGAQTISGDANLVGSNILSNVSIFGVSGTVDFITCYSGSSAPSSSTGSNGDIYLQA